MTPFKKALWLFAALSCLGPVEAHASVLTFDLTGASKFEPILTYGTRIDGLSDADGSYGKGNGFTPNITTSYRTIDPFDNSEIVPVLDWWDTGYGDLTNVAVSALSGMRAEITLTPDPSVSVRLNGFDLAGWGEDYPDQPLFIYDQDYNLLLDGSPIFVPGSGRVHVGLNLTHHGAIHIQFGDTWNVGIDNIDFDQVAPEPSTLASAIVATLAAAALSRGRRLGFEAS